MVVGVLEKVLGGAGVGKSKGEGEEGKDGLEGMTVVDFCSGAGGPIQTIERIMK